MTEAVKPARWEKIIERVREVCRTAGRAPDEVKILPVTKGFGPELIRACWEFGFTVFGENRVAEYLEKKASLKDHPAAAAGWQMIGHLQSNKVRKIIGEFELIHSFDRQSLIDEFTRRLAGTEKIQKVLLQVNVSGEDSKYGATPEAAPELLEKLLGNPNLEPLGLMTMAPWTDDEEIIRQTFAGCRRLRDRLTKRFDIALPELSMGMTNDYEIAIQEGATLLRLGRLLFGERE